VLAHRALTGPSPGATLGSDHWVTVSFGPVTVREPVRVVAVVDEPDRFGFAYGTLEGHPVSGEEAFVVHRAGDGRVNFTVRSLTAPGRGPWRRAFPLLVVLQRWYRWRYVRAVRRAGSTAAEPR